MRSVLFTPVLLLCRSFEFYISIDTRGRHIEVIDTRKRIIQVIRILMKIEGAAIELLL